MPTFTFKVSELNNEYMEKIIKEKLKTLRWSIGCFRQLQNPRGICCYGRWSFYV